MTSQLSVQLQGLRNRPVGNERLSESFLFSDSDSRNLSREQVHQLAVHGLRALIAIDNRFHAFIYRLFSPHGTRVDRKQLRGGPNEELNEALEQLLTLLSPHLFLTAAHQVFEYLVRVHEVHVYNVLAVLRAFLPYHDHSLFSRALLLLDLRDTGFDFLIENQGNGSPLLRESLVQACAASRKVLHLVCMTFAASVRMRVQNGAANALFVSVAVGLASRPNADATWRALLPFIMEFMSGEGGTTTPATSQLRQRVESDEEQLLGDGVQGGEVERSSPSREAVCGVLVVLCAWGSEVKLSVAALKALMKPIFHLLTAFSNEPVSSTIPVLDLLAVVDVLFSTQWEAVSDVTFSSQVEFLLSLPWKRWTQLIESSDAKMCGTLISVLLRSCLYRLESSYSLQSVSPDVVHFVECAVEALPLDDSVIAATITALIKCNDERAAAGNQTIKEGGEETRHREARLRKGHQGSDSQWNEVSEGQLTSWVRALERRFGHVFDATLSQLLRDAATQQGAAKLLAQHLGGARYELLEVRGVSDSGDQLPLFACLLHPIPEVRQVAARYMKDMPIEQLTASSSSRLGADHGDKMGNSLLDLLGCVARCEQSSEVAGEFLDVVAVASRELIRVVLSKENGVADAAPGSVLNEPHNFSVEINPIAQLRSLFRSMWAMSVSQGGVALRRGFVQRILYPLMRRVHKQRGGLKSKLKNKSKVVETGDACDSAWSLVLYYLTLLYVHAVDQWEQEKKVAGECGARVFGSQVDINRELHGLIAELEQYVMEAIPGIGRSLALFVPASHSGCGGQHNVGDCSGRSGDGKRATAVVDGVSGLNSDGVWDGGACLAVFGCVPLLSALFRESSQCVCPSLERAMHLDETNEDSNRCTRATILECCLGCASLLSAARGPEAVDAAQMLLSFFVGAKYSAESAWKYPTGVGEGYLIRLQRTQRAATSGRREKIDRGAMNDISSPFLPKNQFTWAMGAIVRASMEVRLAAEWENAGGPECGEESTFNEISMLAHMGRLLGYLNVPMPAVALNPLLLPPVYLSLLELCDAVRSGSVSDDWEAHLPVDWFSIIYRSVFETSIRAKPTAPSRYYPSALFLTITLPLAAPKSIRGGMLRMLRGIVLSAAENIEDGSGISEKMPPTVGISSAWLVVEATLRGRFASVTTLTALIENIAGEGHSTKLTDSASEFLCSMMANEVRGYEHGYSTVPFSFLVRVTERIYPTSVKESNIAIKTFVPLSVSILELGSGEGEGMVSPAAARFLQAVCVRAVACAEMPLLGEEAKDALLQLYLALVRHPFLRVKGSRVQLVYRHALTAFASILSRGIDASRANPLIFVPETPPVDSQDAGAQLREINGDNYRRKLADVISKVVLDDSVCLGRLGKDMLSMLVGTVGGYQHLFLPLLTRKLEQQNPDLSIIVEALEMLASPFSPPLLHGVAGSARGTADEWVAPTWCTLHNPLKFTDVECILRLCARSLSPIADRGGYVWKREENTLLALRVLRAIVELSHSIRFGGDGNNEGEEAHGGRNGRESSLFVLFEGILRSFPLASLLPLLEGDENDLVGGLGRSLCRSALSFVRCVVRVFLSSKQELNDSRPDGAAVIFQEVVKQGVVLMVGLLVPEAPCPPTTPGRALELDATTGDTPPCSRSIDNISELLKIVSPFLTPAAKPVATGDFSSIGDETALHILIVALLIRFESVNFRYGKYNYANATEVCRCLLASFDVRTQLRCLTGMMQLLTDPNKELSPLPVKRERKRGRNVTGMDAHNVTSCESGDDQALRRLFRKIVKPNQVINRQEEIMCLINDTVKSEAFLRGFVALQHSTTTSSPGTVPSEGARDDKTQEEALFEGINRNNECMALLVSSLELFAHYTELNASTVNDIADVTGSKLPGSELRNAPAYGETKAFVMLLELLAGNTLACVLAGINEPTFVMCMKNLLTDSRMALQLKGMEMLLDRLHNALPTMDNTLTREEAIGRRQELRDPKRRLTLMDVARLKARPFATKRSFVLFSHLSALMEASIRGLTEKPPTRDGLKMLVLSVGCTEELVRIVASGGSQHAEATLLNVNRATRVTEEKLNKLFGNHSRVKEVHQWVDNIVSAVPSLFRTLIQCTGVTLVSAEDLVFPAAAMLTALGTVCQVMGTAFIVPHSNAILQMVVDAAVLATPSMISALPCGEVGSLLRHSALNCLLRTFPSSWLMCHPHLSRIIYVATHLQNVDDAETNYLSVEVMSMLEAVLEPRLFVEACADCVRGVVDEEVVANSAGNQSRGPLRVRVDTHSLSLLYSCVQRRVTSLSREDLRHLSVFVGGTTTRDNFWLLSLQMLADVPTLPSSDMIQPVLDAYTSFFLKFKAKHCKSFISVIAEWAFGGCAGNFVELVESQQDKLPIGRTIDEVRERDEPAASISCVVVRRWLVFYTLCNHLLERLGTIMDFAFPVLLPFLVNTLTGYCSSSTNVARHATGLIARTLECALSCVNHMAVAQTALPDHDHSVPVENCLATPEVFNAVMPAVLRQLTNLVYLADDTHDYNFRVEQHVIPAVRALFRSLTSSKQQSGTQRELLRALRHPSSRVRRAALQCLGGIYEDGGGELAARLMAEMLPSVAELTEDRDDAVVEQARKLCVHLSSITGQDVLYAMSS